MNYVRRFDDWLIDSVFQKIADWFCSRFGWSCFILGRIYRAIYAIGMFCQACWIDSILATWLISFSLGAFWIFVVLRNAATPAPWTTCHQNNNCLIDAGVYSNGIRLATTINPLGKRSPRSFDIDANADFIAEARTALPELIAEVRRLQGIKHLAADIPQMEKRIRQEAAQRCAEIAWQESVSASGLNRSGQYSAEYIERHIRKEFGLPEGKASS